MAVTSWLTLALVVLALLAVGMWVVSRIFPADDPGDTSVGRATVDEEPGELADAPTTAEPVTRRLAAPPGAGAGRSPAGRARRGAASRWQG